MLHDTDTTLATLHQLQRTGHQIAMDDFGTGYSSLSYLRRFPVRPHQDRPVVRARTGQTAGLHGDRARGGHARQGSRHGHHRRGCRDTATARHAGAGRLHRGPGLSVQPAGPGGQVIDLLRNDGEHGGYGAALWRTCRAARSGRDSGRFDRPLRGHNLRANASGEPLSLLGWTAPRHRVPDLGL